MGLQTPYPLEAMPAVRTARDVSDRGQNVASNHQLRLLPPPLGVNFESQYPAQTISMSIITTNVL